MVRFEGHVEAIREGDLKGTGLYIIPYKEIKALIFKHLEQHDPRKSSLRPFWIDEWHDALSKADDDFRESLHNCWKHIFSVNGQSFPADDLRGVLPGNALKLLVDCVHHDKSYELLFQLTKIKKAAHTNSEGLRKLVKKYDKRAKAKYSLELLPNLYTSSVYSAQTMLQEGIDLLTELLEESSPSKIDSEDKQEHGVEVRLEEVDWLRQLCESLPQYDLLPSLVSHRGFHSVKDREDIRPIENSLSAYETAWTSGIHLCECDIAITKDGKLVLAHDENFRRLALDSRSKKSSMSINNLTFRELMALPLKSGVRPPLLLDVLRSARAISDNSQLVIEIKPGNELAASALARLLIRHPELRLAVAMIMSFDVITMHRLQAELGIGNTDLRRSIGIKDTKTMLSSFNQFGSTTRASLGLSLKQADVDENNFIPMPKLMLLTVADSPSKPCEQQVSVQNLSPVKRLLRAKNGSSLDGVYLQYEESMMTAEGAASLRELSEDFLIGVWTYSGIDPDNVETLKWLVREGNCTFVNTDLPRSFSKDIMLGEKIAQHGNPDESFKDDDNDNNYHSIDEKQFYYYNFGHRSNGTTYDTTQMELEYSC